MNKSPATLFAGLGASAAILMLVFKDSILGFVAGIQLSANDMVRPGDWVTLPSGDANGIVQEITLNTVKIQNFDNTISTIPPYTLVSSPFQNWRGMTQSGGRRVMKSITLDLTTLQFCTPEMLDRYRKEIPLMADYQPERSHDVWSTYSSLLLLPKQSLERIRTYPVGHLRPFAGNGSEVRFEGLSVFGLIHHLHHRGHGEIEVRNSCLII